MVYLRPGAIHDGFNRPFSLLEAQVIQSSADARNILTQNSDKALDKNGELDVAAFVKTREFEIKALGKSMGDTKKVLASRAFQQVPKELRRRTASHNVKRVPKRLRARAAKEVRDSSC